jgi:hypothetical protein
MRKGTMLKINERGIAMMTVIYVAAVLMVVSSTATFLTIKEFRAGGDDRRGAEALGYAESGVDRLMLEFGRSPIPWSQINEAGCKHAPISVPTGDLGSDKYYNAYLTVFDTRAGIALGDRVPDLGTWKKEGDTWSAPSDLEDICQLRQNALPDPEVPLYFAISSTGEHPTAKRVVRQVVAMRQSGMPIGLYALQTEVKSNNVSTFNISLVSSGDVLAREGIEFTGYDPYYKLGHFWEGQSMAVPAPAAAHVQGTIYCKNQVCGNDGREHDDETPTLLECRANPNGQSQWDQSGFGGSLSGFSKCPAWTGSPAGPPPYSSFSEEDLDRSRPKPDLSDQDYANLKAQAKRNGMYCVMNGNKWDCQTPNGLRTLTGGQVLDTDVVASGVAKVFVAYFDFPTNVDPLSQSIAWKAAIGPCSDDPALNRGVIVVARRGGLDLTGKGELVGTFLAEDGEMWIRGSGGIVKVHGTTIAKQLNFGGNAEVVNSECWVRNMPSNIFLRVTPVTWSELDR